MNIVIDTCSVCKQKRKFVQHTPRHKELVCGNCWDWEKRPPQPLDLCGGTIGKL